MIDQKAKMNSISNDISIDQEILKENFSNEIEQSLTKREIFEEEMKKKFSSIDLPFIICRAKENNPNFLSIIFANKKFQENFNIDDDALAGKNYDFLFDDLSLENAKNDFEKYVSLIKAVKNNNEISVNLSIKINSSHQEKTDFKITFKPIEELENYQKEQIKDFGSYGIFIFEKNQLSNSELSQKKYISQSNDSNFAILKNLERSLRNERLLREIGYLIVSDVSIRDIAFEIAKMICDHFKVERCLINDYQKGNTNFVIEYCSEGVDKMLVDVSDPENIKTLTDYINFQNYFYQKVGNKSKRSSIIVVDDTLLDVNFSQIHDICKKYKIFSQILITTSFNETVNGGIYIHQSSKRSWLVDELELLETIADQFSIALDRSYSVERVMISNHELLEKTKQLKEALKEEKNMRKMQSEFVALVSHEFKTPLQIIDSTRELLMRKIKSLGVKEESIDKSLERIKSGISRMNGLIHSTLNLAKMENGQNSIKVEKNIFDLKAFIFDIIEKNSNLATQKNIKILTKIDDLPSQFNGDQKLLDHSITNIISNAVKYSKDNSVVKIIAKTGVKKLAIKVVDQGIGIPKEDLANIGQKFFRAKNTLSVAGTGIGLYLTKYFIELHGGEIKIESEVNVGTSVTVILSL
jgi:signal transduction histidine kinase